MNIYKRKQYNSTNAKNVFLSKSGLSKLLRLREHNTSKQTSGRVKCKQYNTMYGIIGIACYEARNLKIKKNKLNQTICNHLMVCKITELKL